MLLFLERNHTAAGKAASPGRSAQTHAPWGEAGSVISSLLKGEVLEELPEHVFILQSQKQRGSGNDPQEEKSSSPQPRPAACMRAMRKPFRTEQNRMFQLEGTYNDHLVQLPTHAESGGGWVEQGSSGRGVRTQHSGKVLLENQINSLHRYLLMRAKAIPIPDFPLLPLLLTAFRPPPFPPRLCPSFACPFFLPSPLPFLYTTDPGASSFPPAASLEGKGRSHRAEEGDENETRKATCRGASPLLLTPWEARRQQNKMKYLLTITSKNIGHKKGRNKRSGFHDRGFKALYGIANVTAEADGPPAG